MRYAQENEKIANIQVRVLASVSATRQFPLLTPSVLVPSYVNIVLHEQVSVATPTLHHQITMAALTPPRSQSNTPVRPVVGSTSARMPTSPIASSLADPLASGSAESSSPEKGPADLASDNEKMEGDSPVDSDIGSDREREELEDQGLVMASQIFRDVKESSLTL
jgi:hypothetical protein